MEFINLLESGTIWIYYYYFFFCYEILYIFILLLVDIKFRGCINLMVKHTWSLINVYILVRPCRKVNVMWLVGIYLPFSDIWVWSVIVKSDVKFFFWGILKVNNKETFNPDCIIYAKIFIIYIIYSNVLFLQVLRF